MLVVVDDGKVGYKLWMFLEFCSLQKRLLKRVMEGGERSYGGERGETRGMAFLMLCPC